MTLDQLLASARQSLSTLLAERASRTTAIATMRDQLGTDAAITEASVTEVISARDALDPQIEAATARVAELEGELARDNVAAELAARITPTRVSGVTVGAEPETYRRGGEHSYFRDLWMSQTYGRRDATERLVRNDAEVFAVRAADGVTGTDGAIGEFVPPIWLVNEFEKLARPGRVIADQIRNQPLPGGTDSISLPLVTGGSSAAEQTQGSAFSQTDLTSSSATAAVTTLGGIQRASIQLVEQSPINIESVILQDLAAEYAKVLDTFVINNNAANKRGLLNVTGINAVTYTDASPTVPEIWPKIVDAKRQIHKGRYLPATHVFMHPDRWAWFEAALDANNRPYVSDDLASAIPLLGTTDGNVPEGLAGKIRGLNLPVFLDPNIPTTLGGGTEDRIIFTRSPDITLYEGAIRSEAFRETEAKTGQIVFRVYTYAALMSARAPKSISVISGTGVVAPTW